jgi:hypothetical protein
VMLLKNQRRSLKRPKSLPRKVTSLPANKLNIIERNTAYLSDCSAKSLCS